MTKKQISSMLFSVCFFVFSATFVQAGGLYLNEFGTPVMGNAGAGSGLGGAAMEGEMLDSVTGKQLAAIVQVLRGTRWTMSNMTTWGDAKNVIDAWAKQFRQRLDESRK